jgi:hypothetical protein
LTLNYQGGGEWVFRGGATILRGGETILRGGARHLRGGVYLPSKSGHGYKIYKDQIYTICASGNPYSDYIEGGIFI